MENKASIVISNLSKSYSTNNKKKKKTVLKNISINIKEGERVGIIGRNGAGKSTLLNILCGFSRANSGEVKVNGRINSILDIGTNLMMELSGKENIYQTALMYDVEKSRFDEIVKEIEEFVDIGEYWNRPVKTYSSGMKARIAFAQIAFIEPEILIIDEILGVGDHYFVQKSMNKIAELCNRGKILIIVSHSLESIQQMATRCIWIDKGEVMMDGTPEEVTKEYQNFLTNIEQEQLWSLEEQEERKNSVNKNKEIYINKTTILRSGNPEKVFTTGADMEIEWEIMTRSINRSHPLDLRISIEDSKGNIFLSNTFSEDSGFYLETDDEGVVHVATVIEKCDFVENTYVLVSEVLCGNKIVDKQESIFKVIDPKKEYYSLPLGYTKSLWDIRYKGERLYNEHIWSNSGNI